jgi:hypothetical protein
MNTKPKEGELIDVVVNVDWHRKASTKIDDKEYESSSVGSFPCNTPSDTDFTAYPDLTEEQVIGWLESGMDISEINKYLDTQLENTINPPVVILPLPWQSSEDSLLNEENYIAENA